MCKVGLHELSRSSVFEVNVRVCQLMLKSKLTTPRKLTSTTECEWLYHRRCIVCVVVYRSWPLPERRETLSIESCAKIYRCTR